MVNTITMCTTTQVITVLDGVIHCLLGYLLSFRELPAKVNKARVTMSSATSDVTYTSVYTDSEPGRAFWGDSYRMMRRYRREAFHGSSYRIRRTPDTASSPTIAKQKLK
ncbi:hypothetical protein Tco_0255471 [Tanacetum coccineum]